MTQWITHLDVGNGRAADGPNDQDSNKQVLAVLAWLHAVRTDEATWPVRV